MLELRGIMKRICVCVCVYCGGYVKIKGVMWELMDFTGILQKMGVIW